MLSLIFSSLVGLALSQGGGGGGSDACPSSGSGGGPDCNPNWPCWNVGHRQTTYNSSNFGDNSTIWDMRCRSGIGHPDGNCPPNQGVMQDGFMQARGHPDNTGWMATWDFYLPRLPDGTAHPTVEEMMDKGLNCSDPNAFCYPHNHPNLDMICDCNRNSRNQNLPGGGGRNQPCFVGLPAARVYPGHPDIDAALRRNDQLPPGHPDMTVLMGHLITIPHPELNSVMKNREWINGKQVRPLSVFEEMPTHPFVDLYIVRESAWLTAGSLLSLHCAGLLVLAILARLVQGKYCVCCSPDESRFALPIKTVSIRYSNMNDIKSSSVHNLEPESGAQPAAAEGFGAPLLAGAGASDAPLVASQRSNALTGSRASRYQASNLDSSSVYRSRLDESQHLPPSASNASKVGRPSNLFRSKLMNSARASKVSLIESSRSLRYSDKMKYYAGDKKDGAPQQSKDPLYDFGEYADLPSPPPASAPKIWSNDMSAYEGSVCSPCATCFNFRFPGSQWSTGEIMVCVVYALLNLWCIFLEGWTLQFPETQHAVGRAFGSLSVANYMFTIIPATRNNILTWSLGLPFDHVILYHRAIGRWALFTAFIHGALYIQAHYTVWTYTSGYAAFGLGAFITITSIEYFRRQHFNFFFVTHFAFLPFFYFVYTHTHMCEPYVWVGLFLYALDRVLREVWSGLFYRSVEFYAKGDELAVVNCVKNPITDALGMHKVGQYYFINFPSISYSEWHPFSVSNGPRETDIEFHIRDLGDWTHDVCQKAIQHSQNPSLPKPYCRIDGPYGVHDFDCRRYPRMVLVGGGVGITPVMGILKDIYNVGKFSDAEKYRVKPHIVDTVYAVWVCRYREDADWFLKDLEQCAQNSMLPQFPKLQTWIYITRGDNLPAPLVGGRPEFADIFRELDASSNQDDVRKIHKAATFVFSCGPGAMVNELWDLSMNRTLEGLRTDFHHETFDF